jgi:phage shock protein C
MSRHRSLRRSKTKRIIAGVCGGLSEYLGVNVTVVRVLWVLYSLALGSGIIPYVIAWIVIPTQSESDVPPEGQ